MKKFIIVVLLLPVILFSQTQRIPLGSWVTVEWQAPPDSNITKYTLYFVKPESNDIIAMHITEWNVGDTTLAKPLQVTLGLGQWELYMTAWNAYNNESPPSNVVPFEIIPGRPGAPLNVRIKFSQASIKSEVFPASIRLMKSLDQVQDVRAIPIG